MAKPIDPDVRLAITKARAALLIDQPFFGSLSLRLKVEVMPDQVRDVFKSRGWKPTLAVNGKTMYYCEDFVRNLDPPLLKSAIAHEVGHCVFDHITRRGSRDPEMWNVAGDYVINDMLKEAGFPLDKSWLYNAQYKGWTTDQIYNSFPPGSGGGDSQPQDMVMDGTTDPSEISASENDWKVATVQAANAAKQEGKLPASVSRFVEELVQEKNDWRERLRRFITEKSKDEYNWMRPNRRFLEMGFYLPTLYSERMGTMVVVTDDSGSIGNDILSLFAGETKAARNAVRPNKTYIISCDAAVNHVAEYDTDDDIKIENHGGGGTDFRPPFTYLEEKGIKPACLIYLTDMYGTFPTSAPDYPVLWCAITDVKAPWGETIKIEMDS